MKTAGFTFIRNAIRYDFPVAEAIRSVLPLCDVFFVAVGKSEDQTLEQVRSLDPAKIRVIETVWDERLVSGGTVYASETDKAFDAIPGDYDWCIYIQGDEVLHEKHLETVRKAMERWLEDKEVEGLLFRYLHFYGTYDYIGDSRHWYRREVRVIRNNKEIRSYRDAQGFRKGGRKIKAAETGAEIYHYGWVRHPRSMQQKIEAVRRFYGQPVPAGAEKPVAEELFDYGSRYDALARFEGEHPRVMQERISRLNWKVEIDTRRCRMNLRYRLLYRFEKLTGVRLFEFRNYKIVRRLTPRQATPPSR